MLKVLPPRQPGLAYRIRGTHLSVYVNKVGGRSATEARRILRDIKIAIEQERLGKVPEHPFFVHAPE